MAAEMPVIDYHQLDIKGQKRAIRPKLLKLTDDTRSRKKSKFKVRNFYPNREGYSENNYHETTAFQTYYDLFISILRCIE